MAWLINASQLDKFRKSQKNVVVFDATWHLSPDKIDAREEFVKQHIPGARFLDLNSFHQVDSAIPNMLMNDPVKLAALVGAHGVTNDHKVIFYDNSTCHTSCRALWIFKMMGHNTNQLYVLDGGHAAWQAQGYKMESGEPRDVQAKNYHVNWQSKYIRDLQQMKQNLLQSTEQVVDVRHPVRYAGGPELRPGMRAGHIPGSFCFPYFTMYEADGKLKPLEKIRKQLMSVAVEMKYPIVATCGSGMTATILDFVLDLLNHPNHAVYDGSWSEWGSENLYPAEISLAERPVRTSLDD